MSKLIDHTQFVFLPVDGKDLPDRMALLRTMGHKPLCTKTPLKTTWFAETFFIRLPKDQYEEPHFLTRAFTPNEQGQLPGSVHFEDAWSEDIEVPNLKLNTHRYMTRDLLVFPSDANHTQNIIFGGKLLAEMDLTAAILIKKILRDSDGPACDAVTHKFLHTEFYLPSYVGDLLEISAMIIGCGVKSLTVRTMVSRGPDRIASAEIVFITTGALNPDELTTKPRLLNYVNHGLYVR